MTDPATSQTVHVDILIAEDFVLTELTAVVEVMRLANRVTASDVFHWTFRARTPGPVGCRADMWLKAERIPEKPEADYLFVIGNSNADHPELSVKQLIKSYMWSGAKVVLLAERQSLHFGNRRAGQIPHHPLGKSCGAE